MRLYRQENCNSSIGLPSIPSSKSALFSMLRTLYRESDKTSCHRVVSGHPCWAHRRRTARRAQVSPAKELNEGNGRRKVLSGEDFAGRGFIWERRPIGV